MRRVFAAAVAATVLSGATAAAADPVRGYRNLPMPSAEAQVDAVCRALKAQHGVDCTDAQRQALLKMYRGGRAR